ncbi:MAG: flagellar hook protein FlgE [Syntrophaceae bacterium]|nr:flagellar hook protein FlgE [Syntrophaceae bacterium]
MSSALWIGTTGLTASSKQMDVIGNNLANSNTLGFKAGNTYFASMLNQSLSGGSSGTMQVGQGVSIAGVVTNFGQGSFESTGNATDLAIDGDGFFIVEDSEGAQYFTRAGAFHVNADGYLVDMNNYRVQGYNLYVAGQEEVETDLRLQNVQSAPRASTEIGVGANLNDASDPGERFNVTQTVFDSLGQAHSLAINFMRTAGNGMWGFGTTLDGSNVGTNSANGLKFDAYGNLTAIYTGAMSAGPTVGGGGGAITSTTINRPGQIYQDSTAGGIVLTQTAGSWAITSNGGYTDLAISEASAGTLSLDLDGMGGADITFALGAGWGNGTITFDLNNTETSVADVNMAFGALSNGATIGNANQLIWNLTGDGASTITGYASSSVVKSLSDDGYSSGVLKSLSVDNDGIVNGFFTNGQSAALGQVLLATFPDVTGLQKSGNYFIETVRSGEALRNRPGSGGLGETKSNSLEISNTDVAKEFINMISAQRAYQASAKVITTADTLLSVLMDIKR